MTVDNTKALTQLVLLFVWFYMLLSGMRYFRFILCTGSSLQISHWLEKLQDESSVHKLLSTVLNI